MNNLHNSSGILNHLESLAVEFIIGGSTAIKIAQKEDLKWQPNDLDVFVDCSIKRSRGEVLSTLEQICGCGYELGKITFPTVAAQTGREEQFHKNIIGVGTFYKFGACPVQIILVETGNEMSLVDRVMSMIDIKVLYSMKNGLIGDIESCNGKKVMICPSRVDKYLERGLDVGARL